MPPTRLPLRQEVGKQVGLFPALGLAFVLATLPALVYALFIWWLDRHEKEPLWLLAVAFLWGAVPAIVLGLVLEIVASGPLEGLIGVEGPRKIAEMGLVAPIVEEAVKALILVV